MELFFCSFTCSGRSGVQITIVFSPMQAIVYMDQPASASMDTKIDRVRGTCVFVAIRKKSAVFKSWTVAT